MQSAIVTAITVVGQGRPRPRARWCCTNPALELFVVMAATTVTAAMVGLALSALAKSNEQIMPLLVVAIM